MSEEQKNTQTGEEQTLSAEELRDKYLREIEQSKSYRKRAQTAEERLAQLEAEAEARRQRLLEEKGEFEQLITELQKQLEQYKTKAEQWEQYQTQRRDALLQKLADEKVREIAEALPLDKLEAFVDLHASGPGTPPAEKRPGARTPAAPPKYKPDMTLEEKKAFVEAKLRELS